MNKGRKAIIEGNKISEIYDWSLGGYNQKVLIEGKDTSLPVVITLHGGPGTPIPFSVDVVGFFQSLRTGLLWFIGISWVVALIIM